MTDLAVEAAVEEIAKEAPHVKEEVDEAKKAAEVVAQTDAPALEADASKARTILHRVVINWGGVIQVLEKDMKVAAGALSDELHKLGHAL